MENKKLIYMDNNATTRVYEEVLEAMLPYFKEKYFNPSSMYSSAGIVHKEMENARDKSPIFWDASRLKSVLSLAEAKATIWL